MIWILAAALAVILIIIWIIADNRRIVCTHYALDAGICRRIVQLSDVHSFRHTEKLTKCVRELSPDLIVITGDLWDRSKLRIEDMLHFAGELSKLCSTVYIPGNHEFHEPAHEQIFRRMERSGVTVLRHRIIDLGGLWLLGMDIMKYKTFNDNELRRLSEKEGFRMAAAHFPQFFEEEYSSYGVDLFLCGHAHGGQFRIPFFHKGIFSPGQGLFPKYSEGLHEKNGVKMIVSRGIGNSRFPFRLFNPPEVVVVDLRSRKQ